MGWLLREVSVFVVLEPLLTSVDFRLYYQHDPARIATCPLTVHALLHIAPSIKFSGPVWCYWAFPMERFCGSIQPGIRSRRHPWASMDRYVFEFAQLTQIKTVYNIGEVLALRDPPTNIAGSFCDPLCGFLMFVFGHTC